MTGFQGNVTSERGDLQKIPKTCSLGFMTTMDQQVKNVCGEGKKLCL